MQTKIEKHEDMPIYEFTVDKTGKIIRKTYDEYAKLTYRTKTIYMMKGKTRRIYKTTEQMGKFLNNYLYSFNPDEETAKKIITDTIDEKYKIASKEATRCLNLLITITANNNTEK